MAVCVKRSSITKKIAHKIHQELVLNNGTELMKFYNIADNLVALPYYYAKLLVEDAERPFADVLDILDVSHIKVNERKQHVKRPFSVKFTLNERQVPIMDSVMKELEKNGSILLKACTGFGKSMAAMHVACEAGGGLITFILVTRKQFCSQLAASFIEETDAVVWVPSDKKLVPPEGVNVIICMPLRFHYVPQDLIQNIGTLIIDEAHLTCTTQCIPVYLALKPRYIMALTATPKRRNGMDIMLKMLCGPKPIIKKLDTPVRVIKWNTGIKIPYFKGHTMWNDHKLYIATHKERNQMIANFIGKVIAMRKRGPPKGDSVTQCLSYLTKEKWNKVICMTAEAQNHRKLIGEELDAIGVSHDYMDAKKHKYKESDCLFGTPDKVGTGFDQKSASSNFDGRRINVVLNTLMAATPEGNEQRAGRGCRAPICIFVCMVDKNRLSEKHWEEAILPYIAGLDDVEVVEYDGDPRKEGWPERRAGGGLKAVPPEPADDSVTTMANTATVTVSKSKNSIELAE